MQWRWSRFDSARIVVAVLAHGQPQQAHTSRASTHIRPQRHSIGGSAAVSTACAVPAGGGNLDVSIACATGKQRRTIR